MSPRANQDKEATQVNSQNNIKEENNFVNSQTNQDKENYQNDY